MTNDYYKNIDSTSQQFQGPISINGTDENQTTISNNCINVNEDINNNGINDYKPLLSSHLNSNEVSFNSQDWLIINSVSRQPRPPRQNEFLLLLLGNSNYSSYITWLDKSQGLFIIHQPERVATLWSKVKNRRTIGQMDYKKFSRGLRFYYKSGLMIKTHKKHTFRFKFPINSTS